MNVQSFRLKFIQIKLPAAVEIGAIRVKVGVCFVNKPAHEIETLIAYVYNHSLNVHVQLLAGLDTKLLILTLMLVTILM